MLIQLFADLNESFVNGLNHMVNFIKESGC